MKVPPGQFLQPGFFSNGVHDGHPPHPNAAAASVQHLQAAQHTQQWARPSVREPAAALAAWAGFSSHNNSLRVESQQDLGSMQQRKGRKRDSTNKAVAPAKSVAKASGVFFKGLRRAVVEASNLAMNANLARNSPGSHKCQVGIAVLAVGHGLTDNKNGRVSKEEEARAARRKPQAFLLQDGQIPQATMQKILRTAVEGTRGGSPPAEITTWQSIEQVEKWFARREAERGTHPHGSSKGSGSDHGEPSAPDSRAVTGHAGGHSDEPRTKGPREICKWLREECQPGLDEEDIAKLMHCLSHPDWGIKNVEFLVALSEEDLTQVMTPIREQSLKNFIMQKCKKYRTREGQGMEAASSKSRKTSTGGKISES